MGIQVVSGINHAFGIIKGGVIAFDFGAIAGIAIGLILNAVDVIMKHDIQLTAALMLTDPDL